MIRFSSFLVIFISSLLHSQASSAGWQDIGNGDDIVICKPAGQTAGPSSYYAYDYYEAFYRYKLYIYVPWSTTDSVEIARRLLDRIPHRFDSVRIQAFELVKTMMAEAAFVESLPNAKDSGLAFIGKECRLEQLVLQKEPSSPSEPYYRMNRNHWIQLDPVQVATVMVHEALYRLAPEARKRYSSEPIRYVVALLLSNSLHGFNSFHLKEGEEEQVLRDAGLIP